AVLHVDHELLLGESARVQLHLVKRALSRSRGSGSHVRVAVNGLEYIRIESFNKGELVLHPKLGLHHLHRVATPRTNLVRRTINRLSHTILRHIPSALISSVQSSSRVSRTSSTLRCNKNAATNERLTGEHIRCVSHNESLRSVAPTVWILRSRCPSYRAAPNTDTSADHYQGQGEK